MKEQPSTKQTTQESIDRAWDIAASIKTCILVTRQGEVSRARPMSVNADEEAGKFYFLADASADTLKQIEAHTSVSVVFSDEGANRYASFVGRARVSDDRAKIAELWTVFAKAWWESAEDPSIRLITVTPSEAEIWDGPNRLIAGAVMLATVITGNVTPIGDHAKVKV